MPAGATLKNCYKSRKDDKEGDEHFAVPQSFTFMAREGKLFHFIMIQVLFLKLKLNQLCNISNPTLT